MVRGTIVPGYNSSRPFTASAYSGDLVPEADQRTANGISHFPSFLVRRRKYLVVSVILVFAIIIFFNSSTSLRLPNLTSVHLHPNHDYSPSNSSLEPPQTTVFVTKTVNAPEVIKTAVVEQAVTSTTPPSQEPVVFVLIMWSKSSAVEGALLIKSILMYNSSPSEFHIICDDEAEGFLRSRFALVNRPRLNVWIKFYKPDWQSMVDRIEREGSISSDHSAGIPGLMKLFLHEIVPVKKGIYVDTDAFFISDPTLLWNVFETFKPSTAIVMSSHPDQDSPEWNHASRICSCVMLLHLEKLRSRRLMDSSIYRTDSSGRFPPALSPEAFRAMYGLPGGDGHGQYDNVRLGDQGYWWAIVSHLPEIFQPLSFDFEVTSCLLNTYNIGLGDDDTQESLELSRQTFLAGTPQEGDVVLPKLLHFNCLHGTDVYMEWEGWSNPDDILTQRWGAALKYHAGYKWIWLNSGQSSLHLETGGVVFADEQYARQLNV
ncbi:hypothetical protein D9756_001781 [Leucocoprinus leucothites]|uniref:Uncharacterized protein n=1 Tax=Leucocoprinus leucothites TaxID=201217 RepID=A0A8H5G486_9AGAR|nr:hypothetical protein D9756_001781 [Leucoagaricus leucothites]